MTASRAHYIILWYIDFTGKIACPSACEVTPDTRVNGHIPNHIKHITTQTVHIPNHINTANLKRCVHFGIAFKGQGFISLSAKLWSNDNNNHIHVINHDNGNIVFFQQLLSYTRYRCLRSVSYWLWRALQTMPYRLMCSEVWIYMEKTVSHFNGWYI